MYTHQGLEIEEVHPHLKRKRHILWAVRLLQATIRMACLRKYGRESLKADMHGQENFSDRVMQAQEQENQDLYQVQSDMLNKRRQERKEKKRAAAGPT